MSSTVLLTGETGFLGKRVRASLAGDPEIEARLLGRRLADLHRLDPPVVDTVVHLAAWTTKRRGSVDLERIVEANVVGLQRLLHSLDPPPRRFLFASTTDVYGLGSDRRPSERSPLDPTDAYAASKLLGEHLVLADARARGYEACAMRIGHLYGPGEEAYEKVVPTMIGALMCGRPPTVVGDGRTRRDLLYVDDAAEAIRRLTRSARVLPEVVNLAARETYTIEEIAQTLIDIVGFLGKIRYLSDHPRPPSVSFDTALLSETIGEWERLPLAEGLRLEVAHAVALQRDAHAAAPQRDAPARRPRRGAPARREARPEPGPGI